MIDSAPSHFWAVTAYFNPAGYANRLRNFREFRRRLDVPLVAVELAYGDEFELSQGDADILLQFPGRDVMWQKERLLNVGIAALPPECDKVAWLDCDVAFENPHWAAETSRLLDEYPLVQPFTELFDLRRGVLPTSGLNGDSGEAAPSLGRLLSEGWPLKEILRKHKQGILSENPDHRFVATGVAWACRRELVQQYGLYDACIVGGGDARITAAAFGEMQLELDSSKLDEPRWRHFLQWANPFHAAVGGRIGCTPGRLLHIWHGDMAQRGYVVRHQGFSGFSFDPHVDIALDENGCWRWNSHKPKMHEYLRDYFLSRREDGP